jgi:hypothetical protein
MESLLLHGINRGRDMRRSAPERGGKEAKNWWRITRGLDGEGGVTAAVMQTLMSNCNDLVAQSMVIREGKWRECVGGGKGIEEGEVVGLWREWGRLAT